MYTFADRINALPRDHETHAFSLATERHEIWRERLLTLLLISSMCMGLLMFVPIMAFMVKEARWGIVAIEVLGFLSILALLFFRKLPYQVRASGASLLLYMIGAGVIAHLGPFSGGPAFLFCFSIISGALLGLRAAVAAVALNLVTMVLIGLLLMRGAFPQVDQSIITPARWLAAGASFVLLNSVATISVTFLVRGLKTALRRETQAKAELQERQAELEQEIRYRAEIQQTLSESQERFRLLSNEVSFDGLFVHFNGVIMDANLPFAEMHGFSKQELLGMDRFQLLAPESRDLVRKRIRDKAEGLDEVVALRKDGGSFPIEIRSRNIILGGKEMRAVAVRDITARKQAEQEIRDREKWYRTTFEHTGTGMVVSDQNAEIVMVNQKFCQLVGLPRQDIVGKIKWHKFVDESDLFRLKKYSQLRLGGENPPDEYEFGFKDAKGQQRRVLHYAKLIPGTRNTISSIIDITDRKLAEVALRESEEKFRQIIQASPMGIYMYELHDDGSLVLAEANPAADRLAGMNHEELIGKTIEEAFPALAGSEIPEHYRRAAADGVPWHSEYVDYKDEKIKGSYEIYAFQSAPGKVTVMYMDVTSRRHAEQIRTQLESQLRQSQKMEAIGTLAGGIAHDFNNILGAIMGYGELAQLKSSRGEDDGEQLDRIVKAAERARDLVKQILTFSRRSVTDLQPLDLNQLVEGSVDMLERTIPKMIYIQLKLGGNLQKVRADATLLEQVIMNLAANAADAMPEGGRLSLETSQVSLDPEFSRRHLEIAPGDYLLLTVNDTGRGMDRDTLDHIFDPFFTTKEIGKGTGLGLSTAYGIIKEHGGHIVCQSEPGRGAKFKIYLPVDQEGGTGEQAEAPSQQDEPGGGETLLLVDDEETIRELGGELLGAMGYKVLKAASGEEALEFFKGGWERVDLVILDLGMPGMGGHKCLKRLLAIKPHIKVLIASGYSAEANIKDLLAEGAAGYIPKPFKRSDLLHTVRSLLDG